MLIDEKVELSPSCSITAYYLAGMTTDIALEYTEYSSDHWSSNTDTSICIDAAKAVEIIAFLTKHFRIKENLKCL